MSPCLLKAEYPCVILDKTNSDSLKFSCLQFGAFYVNIIFSKEEKGTSSTQIFGDGCMQRAGVSVIKYALGNK
jgi:hypothetical protein